MADLNGLDNNEEVEMDIDAGVKEKDEAEDEVEIKGSESEEDEDKEAEVKEKERKAIEEEVMSPKEASKEDKGLSQEELEIDESKKVPKSKLEDDEAEEGRKPWKAQTAQKVSKEEKEEHELTHCPYRSWCKYCVEGRSHKMGHKQKGGEDQSSEEVPRISMDYFYLSQKDEKAKEFPMLVAVDESTGEKFARATGRNGVEGQDWMIKEFSEELKTWGHTGGAGGKIILKCDGEASLKAYRNAVAKYHGGVVIPEQPAKGESQSNGAAEAAGKLVREFLRVLKQQMEDKADMKINGDEDIVQWMVRWAAMLVSRYLVGKDGKTSYERRKARTCRLVCIPFGETVWYHIVRKT